MTNGGQEMRNQFWKDFCKWASATGLFLALVWAMVFVCHSPDVETVVGAIVMTTFVASLFGFFAATFACPYARKQYPDQFNEAD